MFPVICTLDDESTSQERSGHHLFPFVTVVQHPSDGVLSRLERVAGSPSALNFIGGWSGIECENVTQRCFDQLAGGRYVRLADHDEVEPGLASHRSEVDDGL